MSIYVLVKALQQNLHQNDLAKWISDRIIDGGMSNYESLKDAQNALNKMTRKEIHGIVKLNLSEDELEKICSEKIVAESTKKILSSIKSFYLNGERISARYLNPKKVEKKHLKKIGYSAEAFEKLTLTKPPLLSLEEIPNDLRVLLFTDYVQFLRNKESWLAYDDREPGCIGDLFNTAIFTYEHLNSPDAKKPLDLSHVIKLHATTSKSVLGKGISRSGVLREGFYHFPLFIDTATREGVIELLQRIKKNNQPDGFMLGEYKNLNIISTFAERLAFYFESIASGMGESLIVNRNNQKNSSENYLQQYDFLKKTAIDDVIKKVKENVPSDAVENIIHEYLKEYKIDDQVSALPPENFYIHAKEFFINKSMITNIKHEQAFEIEYARKSAIARFDNLTEANIEEKADEIMRIIQEKGRISLFTPSAELSKKWAEDALNQYNDDIKNAKTTDEIIRSIVRLVHELEMLHLFYDANCRTAYSLLDEELLLYGLERAVLYNPNRLDLLGESQLVEQVKQGIFRYHYIKNHSSELSEINKRLYESYKKCFLSKLTLGNPKKLQEILNDTSYYQKYSNPLQNKIDEYKEALLEQLKNLKKSVSNDIINFSYSEQSLFNPSKDALAFCKNAEKIIDDFAHTKNMITFFTEIAELEKTGVPDKLKTEWAQAVQQLKAFTCYNEMLVATPKPTLTFPS